VNDENDPPRDHAAGFISRNDLRAAYGVDQTPETDRLPNPNAEADAADAALYASICERAKVYGDKRYIRGRHDGNERAKRARAERDAMAEDLRKVQTELDDAQAYLASANRQIGNWLFCACMGFVIGAALVGFLFK
jgi:hypothetical protein